MAQRLACEVAGIAAIASLAGAGPSEGEVCRPPGPVAVLQVHGDKDDVISYGGGLPLKRVDRARHPSAPETVAGWAQREGVSRENIRPGDIIWFPPGEKHWHGASPECAMSHIAIAESLDGRAVDWMEKVTDAQYGGA